MPEHHSKAAIVSVGDELTLGQALDTNARWLAEQLASMGIVPVEHVTVPDDLAAHVEALRRLAESVDLIVCTGGLGPTADDLTRAALARAMGDSLVEDPIALAEVEAWFAARGRELKAINRTQALRPTRGKTLPNPNGTAPGLFGVIAATRRAGHACDAFCLPGPPREMTAMFEAQVVPRLRPPAGRTVRMRVLHCVGIGESDLAMRLGGLMERTRSPLVGTTASGGIVSIRIRYEGPLLPTDADALLDETERRCRELASPHVFGTGDETLAGRVVHALRAKKQTLAVVESCTGGMLGQAITDVPGSSAAFLGGWITYTNALKTREVGVPAETFAPGGPGAVSAACARAMSEGGLRESGADWCLAITGVAGPDGGSAHKPVGTVYVALAGKGLAAMDVRLFRMGNDRASVREWSAKAALAMLWMHLAGTAGVRLLREAVEAKPA